MSFTSPRRPSNHRSPFSPFHAGRRPRHWPRFAGLLATLAALALAAGCGKPAAGDPNAPVKNVAGTLRRATEPAGWHLSAMHLGESSATLTLEWSGALPAPGQAEVAPLTLPAGLTINTRLAAARRGTQTLAIDTPTTPGWPVAAGSLRPDMAETQFAGFVRGWPIYRVEVRDELFNTVRGIDQKAEAARGDAGAPTPRATQPGPLQLDFTLAWNAKVAPAQAVKAPQAAGREAWTALMRELVLNPDELERSEQWPPPANRSAAGTPSDPRAGAPGARNWARIAVTTTGLVRLDPQRLLTAGFPAAELRPEAIRVFSEGEAIPLLLAPGPQLPAGWPAGVYFWATGGHGSYSAARTYWVTLAPALPPRPLSQLAASSPAAPLSAAPAGAKTLRSVRRQARTERDEQLHTRHGSFLAIEEMRWVQEELQAGVPLAVPLRFPGVDAGQAPPRQAELNFMLDRPQGLGEVRVDVALTSGGPVLAPLSFASEQDNHKTLDLPPTALHDGALTLTLTLNDATATSASFGSGIFFDAIQAYYQGHPALVAGALRLTAADLSPAGDAAPRPVPPPEPGGNPAAQAPRPGPGGAGVPPPATRPGAPPAAAPTPHLPPTRPGAGSPAPSTPTPAGSVAEAPSPAAVNSPRGWLPLEELLGPGGRTSETAVLALKLDTRGEPASQLTPVAGADGPGLWVDLTAQEALAVLTPAAALECPPPSPVTFDEILQPPAEPVDLLLIHHADLREAAQRLARHREEQTARTGRPWHIRLVDVQTIYDHFNHGELSPEAIRQYLRYVMEKWGPAAPAGVLLLGDASSDYLDVARKGVRNWVPTYTYHSGAEAWGSDYWFTTLAGDDDLGDLLVGRIPAASREDAEAMLNNIIGYDQAPRSGPWRARIGFVSDDGEFPTVVDELRRETVPPAFIDRRVYLGEQPYEDNWYLPRSFVEAKRMKVSRSATIGILDLFRGGTTFLTYYGHGSPNIWADERIWFGGDSKNSDNLHLAGSGYRTFVANMTCNSGAIDYPLPPWNICITEDMLRVADGGAVACYVPTGPGITSLHQRMSIALHGALFATGERHLGSMTQLARLRYTLARNSTDMAYMYLLLGDPLTELQMTRDLYSFELSAAAARPGGRVELDLRDVPLAAGQWQAELAGENEAVLAALPAAGYQGARLRAAFDIPTTAPLGRATLRVYGWDPATGRDFAAAAPLELTRPALRLGELSLGETREVPHDSGPRTPPPAAKPAAFARARLSNPGALAASGELEWLAIEDGPAGATTRSLGRETVRLAPGEEGSAAIKLPTGAPTQPLVVEARLTLPEPPADLELPALQTDTLLAAAPAGWCGLLPAMSPVLQAGAESAQLTLTVGAAGDASTRTLALGFTDLYGDHWSTQSQKLTPAGANPVSAHLELPLDAATFNRLRAGGVWLRELPPPGQAAPANGAVATSQTLAFGRFPLRRAMLRLLPAELRHSPSRPSEGDTIFVDAVVENIGNAISQGGSVGLYGKPPAQGGQLLEVATGEALQRLPRIAPGQRLPLRLRWDPQHNAGEQTIHVVLTDSYSGVGTAGSAGANRDAAPPIKLKVRTKAKLATLRTWTEATPQELAVNRMRLLAEVENTGETDGEHIMLSFFRSALQTPDNKLGEVELGLVPAGQKRLGTFTWKFDPSHDYVAGTKLPEPTVQIWLKGSSQRISSVRRD